MHSICENFTQNVLYPTQHQQKIGYFWLSTLIVLFLSAYVSDDVRVNIRTNIHKYIFILRSAGNERKNNQIYLQNKFYIWLPRDRT